MLNILYLEVTVNNVIIVTSTRTVTVLGTMGQVLDRLPEELFCRIHRSFAVAVEKIICFDDEHVTLENDALLPIGKYHKPILEAKINLLGNVVGSRKEAFKLKPGT